MTNLINEILRTVESLVGEEYPLDYMDFQQVLALTIEIKRLRIKVKELEECHHPQRTFRMSLARRAEPAAD